MKKAGIVTLFGEYNFGNRLQNYAVQEVLKKEGLDVETIKYIGLSDDVASTNNTKEENRLKKFKNFNENIEFAEQILYKEYDVPPNFEKNYDYIVMGSDQIWNFTFDKIFSDKALGAFAPKDKKISLSASFGVNYIPEENSELYRVCKKYLNDIKSISVREDAGREIIKNLTGRADVEVLIDPTMMLDKAEWEKVIKKPENLKTDKFILKSFLGNTSDQIWLDIIKIAKDNNCEIIDVSDKNSPFYDVGPAEFLYLEKNAFLVATDSFHSCVFSILFSTPFVVFLREQEDLKSMHSRIETLLKTFKLQSRLYKGEITKDILQNDFSDAHNILAKERERADKFLKNAFN